MQQNHKVVTVPALVFSRVVGYFSPVQNWHTSKQAEFADRSVQSNADLAKTIERKDDD